MTWLPLALLLVNSFNIFLRSNVKNDIKVQYLYDRWMDGWMDIKVVLKVTYNINKSGRERFSLLLIVSSKKMNCHSGRYNCIPIMPTKTVWLKIE